MYLSLSVALAMTYVIYVVELPSPGHLQILFWW